MLGNLAHTYPVCDCPGKSQAKRVVVVEWKRREVLKAPANARRIRVMGMMPRQWRKLGDVVPQLEERADTGGVAKFSYRRNTYALDYCVIGIWPREDQQQSLADLIDITLPKTVITAGGCRYFDQMWPIIHQHSAGEAQKPQ